MAIQLWVAAGTAAERPSEHGCAHLLEHMLFKPFSAGGPAGDLALLVESLGWDANACTSHDETVLYATVPAENWRQALDGILWSGLRPRLEREELAREVEVVVEEIKQYDDDPGARAAEALLARVHAEHAYARPVLGRVGEVRAHSLRRLRAFHRRAYAGARLTLVVAGPVDPKEVLARAKPLLGDAPEASRLTVGTAARSAKIRATVRRADVSECHLLLGWRAPGLDHPDIAALDVAASVLGHGDASRLFCDVRRRAQVVTDVHASLDVGREASTFVLGARTGSAQIVAAARAIQEQLRRLRSEPISAEELARARASLESDLVYRRETVQGQAYALGYYASQTGDLRREQRFYRELAALTPEAVQEAVQTWMPVESAALSVLLPEDRIDAAAARAIRRDLIASGQRKRVRPSVRVRSDMHEIDLDCGLRVRLLPDARVPVAGAWLIWLGGLRAEPAQHAGLVSITAATLARGNAILDGDRLSREIEGMAGGLSGFAGRNSIGLHGESMARHFPQVLGHLIECALTPTFADDEVADERRVALEELAAAADDLGQVAIRELRKLLYGKHAYARSLRGTRSGLRSIDGELLRQSWKNYPIGQAVLGIAGDIDVDGIIDALDARCGGAPRGQRFRLPGQGPRPIKRRRRRTLHRDREQAHIAIGFPGLVHGDPQVPALDVLCVVLGGQSGRLFLALREQEGLVYTVDAGSTEGLDGGHLTIYAATSQDKLERALAAIEGHLRRISSEPIADEELARAKSWLIGQHEIGLQRRSRVASEIAFAVACGRPADRFRGYRERISAVKVEHVLAVASLLLDPRRQARVLLTRAGVEVSAA